MIEVAEHEDEYLFNGGMDCLYSLSGKRFDNIVQIYGPNTINFGIDDDDDNDFKFVYPVRCNGTLDLKHDDFYGKKENCSVETNCRSIQVQNSYTGE
jgi:hypothetical protein